jgi:uncharacterized protein YfbU (UPF0304 family)
MHLTPVERLILLKLINVLELIDPANAEQHNADAQALELGAPAGLARMFELIELEPVPMIAPRLTLVKSEE